MSSKGSDRLIRVSVFFSEREKSGLIVILDRRKYVKTNIIIYGIRYNIYWEEKIPSVPKQFALWSPIR